MDDFLVTRDKEEVAMFREELSKFVEVKDLGTIYMIHFRYNNTGSQSSKRPPAVQLGYEFVKKY